ncbi:MAG: ribose 5-phosphate isomerase B [Oscillospiraceae bacterium]|nr:ribose 5-phosphate isomerase B [Oscillospiraceae bacterium]
MIALGSDHGGYLYKEELKKHLDEKGIEYIDFGTDSTASCDYPVYAEKVCRAIQSGECEKGILICGTGIGMSICANKFKGIRAAVCGDHFSAEFTRKHNDSNVLCMGARTIGAGVALQLADIFLSTEFEGGRHQKRVDMMMAFEEE